MALTDEVGKTSSLDWHDQQISQHRLRHIPCGRCSAVIEHDRRAPWGVVSRLVNKHWEVCPGRPWGVQRPARMSRAPTFPPGIAIKVPIPPPLSQPSSPKQANKPAKSSKQTRVASGWERKRKTENQRKLELEEDAYTMNVTATSVICMGCRRTISLDKRSRYYPGLWLKHKRKCPDVEKHATQRVGAGIQEPSSDTVQAPLIVAGDRTVPDDARTNCGDEGDQSESSLASNHGICDIFPPTQDYSWSDVSSDDSDSDESLHVPFFFFSSCDITQH